MDSTDTNMILSHEHGKALLLLARSTISEKFNLKIPSEQLCSLEEAISSSTELKVKSGTFVTLTINKQLRGCIGSLSAVDSVVDGIKRNALNAAFNDHRFAQLSEDELDKISIEISVLTEPRSLNYSDARDLKDKLRPGVDGVILKKGSASSTFLPQVWTQLPEVEDFLSHLCQKAGLVSNLWLIEHLEISTYQVQHFSE